MRKNPLTRSKKSAKSAYGLTGLRAYGLTGRGRTQFAPTVCNAYSNVNPASGAEKISDPNKKQRTSLAEDRCFLLGVRNQREGFTGENSSVFEYCEV